MSPDVVIVGGGPAGAAAAIAARSRGLNVALLERDPAPRLRPGEAVHPGVEPLLARLGALDRVLAADFIRHEGHWISWSDEPERFVPFGRDRHGAWRGFQLWRPLFDAILLEQAVRAGAHVRRPCREVQPLLEGDRVAGVSVDGEALRGRCVIDATGRGRWLARVLRLGVDHASPRLVAWYGYARGRCPARAAAPAIRSHGDGWTWTARVRPDLYQWVRLNGGCAAPARDWLPDEFDGLLVAHPARGFDVSWTCVRPAAGKGYFLAGDAAFTLDPLSGHGIIKALMSGMLAAHYASAILRGTAEADQASGAYDRWIRQWFARDCAELRALYRQLDGGGVAVPAPSLLPCHAVGHGGGGFRLKSAGGQANRRSRRTGGIP
jgi:flavin-dependent dehydrogenase